MATLTSAQQAQLAAISQQVAAIQAQMPSLTANVQQAVSAASAPSVSATAPRVSSTTTSTPSVSSTSYTQPLSNYLGTTNAPYQTTAVNTTSKYIQDPTNPYASIPNPNYSGVTQPLSALVGNQPGSLASALQGGVTPSVSTNPVTPTTPTTPTTYNQPATPTAPATPTIPTTPTIPVDESQTTLAAIQKLLGTSTSDNDFRKQMTDLMAKLVTEQEAYTTALTSQLTPEETYNKYRELLGISKEEAEYDVAQKAILSTQQLVSDTENMITNLEKDISSRIGGMTGVQITEAQRRRVQATEQKPLTEQLSQQAQLLGKQTTQAGLEQVDVSSLSEQLKAMLGLAGQTQEQKIAAAKAPMEMTASLLPTMAEFAQYQSPAEKLSQAIASEQLMKSLGLGDYATKPVATKYETIGSADSGFYSFNPNTGAIQQLTSPAGGTTVWSEPSVNKLTGKITQTNSKTGEVKAIGDVAGGGVTGGLDPIAASTLTLVNELLNTDLGSVTGYRGVLNLTPKEQALKAKLNQLTNTLAMNARQLIKGSGAISDKETDMLNKSQTTLSTKLLPESNVKVELKKIQGIIRSNAGELVEVSVLKNGKVVDTGQLDRNDIYSALQQGYQVIYL